MDSAAVVKDLARTGAAHFHASYVAKQLGIPTAEAHKELAELQRQGILDVHFDVICPETDRTIKSYKLKEEVPIGEIMIESTGDCQPFELLESDLIVTYSPTRNYLRRLLREGSLPDSKKNFRLPHRICQIVSSRLRHMRSTRSRNKSSLSKAARISFTKALTRRSRKPRVIAQR